VKAKGMTVFLPMVDREHIAYLVRTTFAADQAAWVAALSV
jgi:hypothetical protein